MIRYGQGSKIEEQFPRYSRTDWRMDQWTIDIYNFHHWTPLIPRLRLSHIWQHTYMMSSIALWQHAKSTNLLWAVSGKCAKTPVFDTWYPNPQISIFSKSQPPHIFYLIDPNFIQNFRKSWWAVSWDIQRWTNKPRVETQMDIVSGGLVPPCLQVNIFSPLGLQ